MPNLTIFDANHNATQQQTTHDAFLPIASPTITLGRSPHTQTKPTHPPPTHAHTTNRQQSNPIQQNHLGPSPGRPGTPLSAPPFTRADAGLAASFCCPTRRRRPLSDQSCWAQPPVVWIGVGWRGELSLGTGVPVLMASIDRSAGRPHRMHACPYCYCLLAKHTMISAGGVLPSLRFCRPD